MADDRQKVIVLLTLLKETCSASITPLGSPPSVSDSPSNAINVLRNDFLSLLTLIYTSSTKISLTLRPSEPAYSASKSPIQDITTHVSSLTTCATLFDPHGKVLAEAVRRSATEVCQSVLAFAQGFLSITNEADSSSSSQSKEDYLVRTGTVHECIEKIRKSLPESNAGAVKNLWLQDRAMLDDSFAEVNTMIEEGGDGYESDEGFGDDDDLLDELGLGTTKSLSSIEIERVKKIQPLFRLSTLFYKRFQLDILSARSSITARDISLDDLPQRSQELLSAVDDLVATLYSPQNPRDILGAVSDFSSVMGKMEDTIQTVLPPIKSETEKLATQLSEVSIQSTPKKEKDTRKWFDTCFEQFHKLSVNITDAISVEVNTT